MRPVTSLPSRPAGWRWHSGHYSRRQRRRIPSTGRGSWPWGVPSEQEHPSIKRKASMALRHRLTVSAGVLTSYHLSVTVSQNVAGLQKVIGDAQAAIVGGRLPESLTVQVFDRLGNPIDGAIVRFEATQGGGSVGASSVFTSAAG